ncbi:hypothetical protein ACET3X_008829 [Alternaria dauci]|uniref:Major facilitator superfamily (MFS) profile domain-containing protein n=1 Tax=Alternaria dauci TaxID=48095 RepID=A0ABR3U759_9PLEO
MFGTYNEETQQWGFSARHLSFLNSLGHPAKVVGTLLGYVVGENFGRKSCFIGMQFIVIIGVAVTYSATTYGQALAGRIIVQLYSGVENWLIPMLLAELSPAPIRGASVILYVLSHTLGSLICSFITLGTSKLHDNRSWQIPVEVMWLFPGLCLILSFFIPESPRWLVRQNRNSEATKSLLLIHGSEKGFDADGETARLSASIEADSFTTGSWSDLLKGTNLRQIHIALAVSVFSQFTGGAFVTQYGTIFVRSLGAFDPFSWTVLLRVAMMIGPMVAFATIDTFGRRPVYLAGSSIASALMFAIGGLGIGHVTTSEKKGIIAATILWGPCYCGAFGAL